MSSGNRGYAYIAASILVAAAVIAGSILVLPSELYRTTTQTSTSVVTLTPPTSTVTYTSFTTTSTNPVTVSGTPPPACTTSFAGTSGQPVRAGLAPATKAAATSPVTIDTSTTGSATNSSSQRKTLVASGLTWVFYTDGQNLVYQTSSDAGGGWSIPPVIVRQGIQRGWFFTLAQNGSTVYLVVAATDGSTNAVEFRQGTMNANATITWGVQDAFPYTGQFSDVSSFALDSQGNAWVAINALSSGPSGGTVSINGFDECRNIEVFKDVGGSWSQVFNVGGLVNYARPILLPSASGEMALEMVTETPVTRQVVVYVTPDGGATWSSPVATQSDEMLTLSAVSVGNKVFSVTTDTNGNVYLWQYTYGSASFDGPVTLANWKSGEGDASISTDGSSLFVAYSNATSVSFETSPNLGQTWSPPTVISNTETFIQTDSVNTSLLVGGVVDVVWTTQANAGATSYDVRFAQVSMNT
jgi:hypothetical protein